MISVADLENMALKDLFDELKSALVSLVGLRIAIFEGKEKALHKLSALKVYIAQINMIISKKRLNKQS